MTMTFIYGIFALLFLLATFLVAYRVRGAKFAVGVSLATFLSLGAFYMAIVMFITNQMP